MLPQAQHVGRIRSLVSLVRYLASLRRSTLPRVAAFSLLKPTPHELVYVQPNRLCRSDSREDFIRNATPTGRQLYRLAVDRFKARALAITSRQSTRNRCVLPEPIGHCGYIAEQSTFGNPAIRADEACPSNVANNFSDFCPKHVTW